MKFQLIRFLIMVFICGGICRAKSFHVSPGGSDSNPGTLEKPFATLEQASNAVRTLKSTGLPEGGVSVWLHAGTYVIKDSFKLTKEDSGTENSPITYRAYHREQVILSGGQTLKTQWFARVKDHEILNRIINEDARGKVLQVSLKDHKITDYGQLSRHGYFISNNWQELPQMELFINGERMTLARWPNKGTVKRSVVIDKGVAITDFISDFTDPKGAVKKDPDFWEKGGSFTYDFDRPGFWTEAHDIWLDGIFGKSWEWSYNKVASIDTEKRIITLCYSEVSGIIENWAKDDFFYAENLLEEIDMPGEYYIDRKTGILYLLPPESFAKGSPVITVSMLKVPMLQLKNVSYVTFKGLILETGRNFAVLCQGGEAVRFEDCEIRQFTRGGLMISGTRHAIVNSHLHDIGGTVLNLNGGDWETLTPANNIVKNCYIHHFAYWDKVYQPALSLHGVGQRVSHCLIHGAPHMAITIRGNDHLVEYTELFDAALDFIDMGAIYMHTGDQPAWRGNLIRRNFLHHIGQTRPVQIGFYADGATMGVTVEENVFYKIGSSRTRDAGNAAVNNNSGSYIITRNNIFVDCPMPYRMSYHCSLQAKKKFKCWQRTWKELFAKYDFSQMPHSKKYPELLRFYDEDRILPETNLYERNLIFNPTVPLADNSKKGFVVDRALTVTDPNLLNTRPRVKDNWIAKNDPGFVNLKNMDFTLRDNAMVFKKIPGFKNIPFKEIGLTGPVGPAGKQ